MISNCSELRCSRYGTEYCDDCIPYDPLCSLFEPKSDPASEQGTCCSAEPDFVHIYEQIMTETQSSHIWHLKKE